MYGSKWSINGDAGAQSLSWFGYVSSPRTDDKIPKHTVYLRNAHSSVSLFVGPENPDGGALTSYGYEIKPGEQFSITLSHDQLWVSAPSGQTGSVSFLVVAE